MNTVADFSNDYLLQHVRVRLSARLSRNLFLNFSFLLVNDIIAIHRRISTSTNSLNANQYKSIVIVEEEARLG